MLIRYILDQQERVCARSESMSSIEEMSSKWSEKVSDLERENKDLKGRLRTSEETQRTLQKTMSEQRLMYEELLKNTKIDSCNMCSDLKQQINDRVCKCIFVFVFLNIKQSLI